MHNINHLKLAHEYWKNWLKPTDTVVDATCGNGKDTLTLSKLVPEGRVFSLDIQPQALESARQLVTAPHVTFLLQSHEVFPEVKEIHLIVYNLGYLPGGDKSITTRTESTLISLREAASRADALSITCYPGHPEGERETAAVLEWATGLTDWTVRLHAGKAPHSPMLLWVLKNPSSS